MAADIAALLADLREESLVTESLLDSLPAQRWDAPTPAAAWSIRDQVTHLAFFDEAAALSVTDPARFAAQVAELADLGEDFPDLIAARHRGLPAAEALEWFVTARAALLSAYATADPAKRLPWYGPSMALATSITARLMETWAHTQDIADTLGVTRPPTDRLRHVAHLGVSTMAFAHALHGVPAPVGPVRVDLTGPAGDNWTWGPDDAADRVTGPALDFCLVVTQRRNLADTRLVTIGAAASGWMAIAQAFAGRATNGPPPRAGSQRSRDQRPGDQPWADQPQGGRPRADRPPGDQL